jgi:hypothetical protein
MDVGHNLIGCWLYFNLYLRAIMKRSFDNANLVELLSQDVLMGSTQGKLFYV